MENEEIVVRLFAQEVPEIASGAIEIKAIARKPGYRAKLALHRRDPQVDCVGACVGVRGGRIRKIVDQLGGERIDLFLWNEEPEELIINALQPAPVEQVILHAAEHRAVVVVKAEQLSWVEGPHGENRELASRICGWQIHVATE